MTQISEVKPVQTDGPLSGALFRSNPDLIKTRPRKPDPIDILMDFFFFFLSGGGVHHITLRPTAWLTMMPHYRQR